MTASARFARRFAPLPLALLAVACADRVVVRELSPEEAQRCAIVLALEGLEPVVEPESGGGDASRRSVLVRGGETDLRTALQVLADHGLPRRAPPGFAQESSSLIPTASEERARYIKGLSGEIEGLLESVDGVVSAEALVSLPERRPLAAESDGGASASVVMSHAGETSPLSEEEIRTIVVSAVGSAVSRERVSVLVKAIPRRRPTGPVVKYERDRVTETGFLFAAGVLAAIQAVTVWRLRRERRNRRQEVIDDATRE